MQFIEINADSIIRPRRWVNKFFIHCSAADHNTKNYKGTKLANTIDRWHKDRGWSGIGYHFVIDKDGKLITGRNMERIPAAQGGHNKGTLAVCVHGLKEENFTQAQYDTLVNLCKAVQKAYGNNITFHGHCEVSAKSCPVLDYKELLRLDKHGRLGLL